MNKHVPKEFSVKLRYMHEVEGLRPVEVRAWAKSVGYPLSENTIRYHIKGRTHPRAQGSIANNGQLQQAIHEILLENDERPLAAVQTLLGTRHDIAVGLETARSARQQLHWTWGKLRYSKVPGCTLREISFTWYFLFFGSMFFFLFLCQRPENHGLVVLLTHLVGGPTVLCQH